MYRLIIVRRAMKITYVVDDMWMKHKETGFTLFETLLVLAIMSIFLAMSVRYINQKVSDTKLDKASIQYQQILNAEVAYYINNSTWGSPLSTLTGAGIYLPSGFSSNPWGNPYQVLAQTNLVYIYSAIPSSGTTGMSQINTLVGRLPLAFASKEGPTGSTPCDASSTCYVSAAISIPGQNLSNARSVNFANLYHSGACVPAPVCPANMKRQIMVIPVSVSGLNDPGNVNVYPISSFTAYAVPTDPKPANSNSIPECANGNNYRNCDGGASLPTLSGDYWRVCLSVVTQEGDVASMNPNFAKDVTLLAITRCAPANEPVGSDFSVFDP